jgi:hypothetical protein
MVNEWRADVLILKGISTFQNGQFLPSTQKIVRFSPLSARTFSPHLD